VRMRRELLLQLLLLLHGEVVSRFRDCGVVDEAVAVTAGCRQR
jgi:hypothetical protein